MSSNYGNRKTSSKQYQHDYSLKEDSGLNVNQRKPKDKEVITITADQILKVLFFILSFLIIYVLSSFSNNNSYEKPKNYDKTSRNFSIDGNPSIEKVISRKNQDVVNYFIFQVNEFKIIEKMKKQRDNYLTREDLESNISLLDEHIDIIENKKVPRGFNDVNYEMKQTFLNYKKLLRSQYSLIVTGDKSLNSNISKYDILFNEHWNSTLSNMRLAFIDRDIPFVESENGAMKITHHID